MSVDRRVGKLLVAAALLLSVWLVVRLAGPPAANTVTRDAVLAPPAGTVLHDPLADGTSGPSMVVIPAGRFVMGSSGPHSREEEQPTREVTLAYPLAVARTETTVAQFARFVRGAGYRMQRGCWYHSTEQEWREDARATWRDPGFDQGEDYPVTCINYRDASVYAAWMSRQTGHHYRLPSEAEFEYFSRAGIEDNLPAGQYQVAGVCTVANGADLSTGLPYAMECDDGYVETSPVASFQPNAFGLFDTSGNVWEFTQDCWNARYRASWRNYLSAPPVDGSAWMRGDCRVHVLRGGSYLSSADNLRLARRESGSGVLRLNRSGFRLVREL